MQKKDYNYKILRFVLPFISALLFSSHIYAQHRGDVLSFQGLSEGNNLGIKASAMGGAYTAVSGDINSLFYNPAGLAGINKIQVSISGNSFDKLWRENQVYRPDRYFVTLPFYLEGLYIPKPEDNGKWDHERPWDDTQNVDSTYYVKMPDLGLDPFGEEAADWQEKAKEFAFNNIAVAVPLDFAAHHIVVSASYNRKFNVQDFDRNDTYLDPHLGYDMYGEIGRVNGLDTLDVNWSRYLRKRSGSINNITAGLAYDLNKYLKLGAGMNLSWGETDDLQSLSRVGVFNLNRQQRFRFSYVKVLEELKGKSKFSSTSFNLGAILNINRVSAGIKIDLPYTLKREWDNREYFEDSSSASTVTKAGTDELEVPAVFTFGVSFKPVDNFMISIDYENAPLSKAEFKLETADNFFRGWSNRNTLRFGAEYKPYEFLAILAGFQNVPQIFIPDGAAVKENGPEAHSYNFGVSLSLFFGRLDFAYEYRILKYYDSYYSNTNYNYESYSNLLFGYTYTF